MLFIGKTKRGETPQLVNIKPRDKALTLRFERKGYKSSMTTIDYKKAKQIRDKRLLVKLKRIKGPGNKKKKKKKKKLPDNW